MTEVQILWSINTGLLGVLFYFVKTYFTKLDSKMDKKVDEKSCNERHLAQTVNCNSLMRHKHAPKNDYGTGGEVILP